jgi:hypothetical protein
VRLKLGPSVRDRRSRKSKRGERGAADGAVAMEIVGGFALADGTSAKALTGATITPGCVFVPG